MNNESTMRTALMQAMLERTPQLLQESLLKDTDFCLQLGLNLDPVFSFGDSGIPFFRSTLFDAVRETLAGDTVLNISDHEGNEWLISIEYEEGSSSKLMVSNSEKRFFLPDLNVLSPSAVVRLQSLNEYALDVNLPADSKNVWHDVLSERALEDEEVDEFLADYRDTPTHVARSIRCETQNGKCSVSLLVPCSR